MIVKILSAAASFRGVSYNTAKVEKNKGELLKVANFGPLQALGQLRPEDYINYLKMISARNKGVKAPQFHATISTKGKLHDKEALTGIAVEWLGRMGYADQPYLIIFHKDTGNNHVHMVSTRIDRDGKKISSAFEHNRAIQNLNKVFGLDESSSAKQDLDQALAYQFGTKAQFMMILESKGYKLKELDGGLSLIKFGKQLEVIPLGAVLEKVKLYREDSARRTQLKAIFQKYSLKYDTTFHQLKIGSPRGLTQLSGTYTSDFAEFLKEKFGIHLLFHSRDNKLPYGYSILDHSAKTVWKGSEIMPLGELLAVKADQGITNSSADNFREIPAAQVGAEVKDYYNTLLKAAQQNYPDFIQGLNAQELALSETANGMMVTDIPMQLTIPAIALLEPDELRNLRDSFQQSTAVYVAPVRIADDVDDQQIHGMRRRRQRKSRTNTR